MNFTLSDSDDAGKVISEKIDSVKTTNPEKPKLEDGSSSYNSNISTVDLVRKEDEGFGLNIVGGSDSPHILGIPSIFISMIRPEGVAARDGRLREGDRVISINDIVLNDTTHDEAVNAFRTAGCKARIVVESLAESRIVSEQPNALSSFKGQSPVLNSVLSASSEKFSLPTEPASPSVIDYARDDDGESVTSYTPSTHSIIDDVPRTPRRPAGLLDSKSVNALTEVLYVSIGLGVIGLGAVVIYKFVRGKR